MLKRKIFIITVVITVIMFAAGCSGFSKLQTTKDSVTNDNITQSSTDKKITSYSIKNKDNGKNAEDIGVTGLPSGIKAIKSERKPNQELKQLIIDYYQVPKKYRDNTRYYYNYIDIDQDGKDDIFVLVVGPYTSGTGGSSALWVYENDMKLHVKQEFTLVNPPIIISNKITNHCHELVIPYYGGSVMSSYSILQCKDDYYPRVSQGQIKDSLKGITGKAIICDNIALDEGQKYIGLNLGDK